VLYSSYLPASSTWPRVPTPPLSFDFDFLTSEIYMSMSPVPVDVGEKIIARRMQRLFIIFRLFHKYMSRLRHYFLMLVCVFLRILSHSGAETYALLIFQARLRYCKSTISFCSRRWSRLYSQDIPRFLGTDLNRCCSTLEDKLWRCEQTLALCS
jgi:hypothetical protein